MTVGSVGRGGRDKARCTLAAPTSLPSAQGLTCSRLLSIQPPPWCQALKTTHLVPRSILKTTMGAGTITIHEKTEVHGFSHVAQPWKCGDRMPGIGF